ERRNTCRTSRNEISGAVLAVGAGSVCATAPLSVLDVIGVYFGICGTEGFRVTDRLPATRRATRITGEKSHVQREISILVGGGRTRRRRRSCRAAPYGRRPTPGPARTAQPPVPPSSQAIR